VLCFYNDMYTSYLKLQLNHFDAEYEIKTEALRHLVDPRGYLPLLPYFVCLFRFASVHTFIALDPFSPALKTDIDKGISL
jgi:hypothetical protein